MLKVTLFAFVLKVTDCSCTLMHSGLCSWFQIKNLHYTDYFQFIILILLLEIFQAKQKAEKIKDNGVDMKLKYK